MSSIKTIFTNIANAIREKKGTTTKYLPENMSAEISTIETGIDTSDATVTPNDILLDKTAYANGEKIVGTIQTYNNEHENGYVQIDSLKKLLDTTKSAYYLFSGYKGTSVDDLIQYSDTENVTNMQCMFHSCSNLRSIPLLDTSKATYMGNMFTFCEKLQTIPQLNTSNVTNMYYMFADCKNLWTIPQLDTSNVTIIGYMFNGCNKLQTIDLTHMKITDSSYSSNMCSDCYSLTKFIIRNMDTIPALSSDAFTNCYHFTGTRNSTYNPKGLKDGRIYVPDDKVAQLKQATNWSKYASIIVGLSELYIWVTTSKSFSASMTTEFNINGKTYLGTTQTYSIDLGPGAKNISLSSDTGSAFVTSLADYSYNSTTGILTVNKLYNMYPTSSATITVKYDTRKYL